MPRVLLLLLVCLSLSTGVHAGDWSAKLVDYGVYRSEDGPRVRDEAVAGGLVVSYGKSLIAQTDRVEARIGTSFGYRYRLVGPGDSAEVTIRVRHPEPLRDPTLERPIAVSTWSEEVPVGPVNWNTGWIFESDWELVPGDWVMQLYVGKQKLLEHRFTVVVAPGA